MQDLEGKVAVITGAASGIGRAASERFAKAGMKVAMVDIERPVLEEAAHAVSTSGADILPCCVDVGDANAMDDLAEEVLRHFGGVHLLHNNAGVGSGGPIWECTVKDWEYCLRVNLWGVIHGMRAFTKHLVAQDEGHIINTASMAGLVSVPGLGPYNVSKFGVLTLSETLAGDLQAAGSKVGVSVLCPGFVDTQIWNSERNRDAKFQNDMPNPAAQQIEEGIEAFHEILQQGIRAEEVGQLVLDAVRDDRFYIFTHEGARVALEHRFKKVLEMQGPALPQEGIGVFLR
jgi:NAD(P)-dependent dehydrogenase (short-subunit alcohol dehydrogenase family)